MFHGLRRLVLCGLVCLCALYFVVVHYIFSRDSTGKIDLDDKYREGEAIGEPVDEEAERMLANYKYAFSLTTTKRRSQFLCKVLETLWAQTIPPQEMLIFHGPDVVLPTCASDSNRVLSMVVPDTGPSIKLRHLLLQPANGGHQATTAYDVIVVDDDTLANRYLARTLLLQSILHYPDSVLINNPDDNFEHYRCYLWAGSGYFVPKNLLGKVTWQDNPDCFFDDDIWLGYLFLRSGLQPVSIPGVRRIGTLRFNVTLSQGINQDGGNRSKCTRSLARFPKSSFAPFRLRKEKL